MRRKYKDIPEEIKKLSTAELLEESYSALDVADDKAYTRQQQCKHELANRSPFSEMKIALDQVHNDVDELRKVVGRLQYHKHVDGDVVIPEKQVHQQCY
ncbi:hypothetical protein LCGC14_2024230 [marine sediment metagenome]|uniref:Uncharacterized protein n=1 Tax=marine sediment metagenome TaxID=412755 RepID=A0A0F9HTN9_9ZZZZ